MLDYKYVCQYCKYKTDSSSNYKRHLKTLKHQENVKLFESKAIIHKSLDTKNLDIVNNSKPIPNNCLKPLENIMPKEINNIKKPSTLEVIKTVEPKNIDYLKNNSLTENIKFTTHKKNNNFTISSNPGIIKTINLIKTDLKKNNNLNLNGIKLIGNTTNININLFSLNQKSSKNYGHTDSQIIKYSNKLNFENKNQNDLFNNINQYNNLKYSNNFSIIDLNKQETYKLNFIFKKDNTLIQNNNNFNPHNLLNSNNHNLLNSNNQKGFNFLKEFNFQNQKLVIPNNIFLNHNYYALKSYDLSLRKKKNIKIDSSIPKKDKTSLIKEYNYDGYELIS